VGALGIGAGLFFYADTQLGTGLLDDLFAIFPGELLALLAALDRLLDLGDFVLRDVAALVGAILPGVEVII
jgi:hypothetical protein